MNRKLSSFKRKSPSRTSRRKSSKSRVKLCRRKFGMTCKEFLKYKIGINMHEFPNKKQALAISYAQTRKMFPNCKHI